MPQISQSEWTPKAGEIVLWQPTYQSKGFKRPLKTAVVKRVHEDGTVTIKAHRQPMRRVKLETIRPYEPPS